MDRFDKFSERLRHVFSGAQSEARHFGHDYVGSEHLLLSLSKERDGIAHHVFVHFGATTEKLTAAVEFILGRGDRVVVGEVGLTPRAKKAVELAVDEARRLNTGYIGTEHLLIGLIREGEGMAAGILESFGMTLEKTRVAVLNERNGRVLVTHAHENVSETSATESTIVPKPSDREYFYQEMQNIYDRLTNEIIPTLRQLRALRSPAFAEYGLFSGQIQHCLQIIGALEL